MKSSLLSAHKVGCVFAGLFGGWHILWSLLVAFGLAKLFLDWIFALHMLNVTYAVTPFSLPTSVCLVVVTGVIGYFIGYLGTCLWNKVLKA